MVCQDDNFHQAYICYLPGEMDIADDGYHSTVTVQSISPKEQLLILNHVTCSLDLLCLLLGLCL